MDITDSNPLEMLSSTYLPSNSPTRVRRGRLRDLHDKVQQRRFGAVVARGMRRAPKPSSRQPGKLGGLLAGLFGLRLGRQ